MTEVADTGLFVSWIRHHGRSADLAMELGLEPVFITGGTAPILTRYWRQFRLTSKLLREKSPQAVFVMQPPLPAILVAWAYAQSRHIRIAGDLHSGAFLDPKWKWSAGFVLRMLRQNGIAITTNLHLAELCRRAGVRTFVIHDSVTELSAPARDPSPQTKSLLAGPAYILVPFAYASDEPVGALLKAATLTPEVTWLLTGEAPSNVRRISPANVKFTGYVSEVDFRHLLLGAGAVAALTNRPYTMQRAGYEAMAAGQALLASDHLVLRDFFGDAAYYASSEPSSIAAAATAVLSSREQYVKKMMRRRSLQESLHRETIREVRRWLLAN